MTFLLIIQCKLLNKKSLHVFAILNLLYHMQRAEEAWSFFAVSNLLSNCCQSLKHLGSWLLTMQVLSSNRNIAFKQVNRKNSGEKKKQLLKAPSQGTSVLFVRRRNSWLISRSNKFWIFFSHNYAFVQTNVICPTRIFVTVLWINIHLVQCFESKISWNNFIRPSSVTVAERVGVVQHGEEETLGRPYNGLSVPKVGLQERQERILYQGV